MPRFLEIPPDVIMQLNTSGRKRSHRWQNKNNAVPTSQDTADIQESFWDCIRWPDYPWDCSSLTAASGASNPSSLSDEDSSDSASTLSTHSSVDYITEHYVKQARRWKMRAAQTGDDEESLICMERAETFAKLAKKRTKRGNWLSRLLLRKRR